MWFRNDLRLHDNPVIHWAASASAKSNLQVLPVFCFDPRFNEKRVSQYNIRKMGIWRSRFLHETVQQFRSDLKGIGSGLLVAHDKPEKFISKLIDPSCVNTIVYQQETCDEELKVET